MTSPPAAANNTFGEASLIHSPNAPANTRTADPRRVTPLPPPYGGGPATTAGGYRLTLAFGSGFGHLPPDTPADYPAPYREGGGGLYTSHIPFQNPRGQAMADLSLPLGLLPLTASYSPSDHAMR